MSTGLTTSFFDQIIESTSAIADAVFGKTFTFCWNGQACKLTAILSAHPIVTELDGTIAESVHSHNFEIDAADLVFGGVQTEPQAGMEIREAMADGSQNVYEIRPRSKARAYDPLDAEETRLLVYANYFQNET
ncbi:MAG: hypothetical protein ACLP9L_18215 [Thermoguttaceae bacterium]